ncbi:NAD-dependent epimerase/dehydratase family protein [Actinomycetospora endophytica]|uniref:NAD-dependent epimerase/dehydratase family protein n=1 Tax=Actinomycetospora endophytica TaxID=2291215 RepID=A0ABS8PEQ7_9PSEU|nr:D-erythronate dehydrogenase [Actinomycetospora endophytica]MCD2196750.1 NAD-dependent epimerase/dehydratase family protein [Actinomycetospora endophytica]
MRIAITGGAGFLGTLLARHLLAGPVVLDDTPPADVDELIIADLAEPAPRLADDPRVTALTGELDRTLDHLGDVDAIFHLAGVVSGAAEADFDLGMRTNLDGTRAVLEHARHQAGPPLLVFTSSLAVFGTDPAGPTHRTVDDDTLPRPQSSYGVQKFIGEQLVADYTRRGFVRGRSVRLMTVSVRPGPPNAAASGFLSGILREPLAGERAACPVPPDTPVALSSPRRTIEGIVRAAAVGAEAWGSRTAMNLPSITTSPREMVEALDGDAARLVDWTEDATVTAIVGSWPARFDTARATALGLRPNGSVDDLVQEYLADHTPDHAP